MRNTYKEAFLKKHGLKLGFMSPFVKATAYALQDQPIVNAVIDENEIIYRDYIDISVAVATPKGLVVPVLRNVNSMNLAQIEKAIAAMGEKVIVASSAHLCHAISFPFLCYCHTTGSQRLTGDRRYGRRDFHDQ